MNKQDFFEELFREIEYFEQSEKDEIRAYYEELIMDGMEAGVTEEEVIQRLDSPKDIANRLKSEYSHGEEKKAGAVQKEQGVYLPEGHVNTVKVQAEDRGIHLVESRDDQVRICYEAQDDDEIIYYEADGMFYFKQKQRSRFNFLKFRIQTTVAPIIVEIPQNQMKLVELTTKNGGIRCMQVAIASALFIETSNGGIRLEQVQADAIDIHTTNAGIVIQSVLANRCSAKSTNSAIKVNNCKMRQQLNLRTTNGSLKFEEVDAMELDLSTTNGSIKGKILGNPEDYQIYSHTTNGSNNLPNGWGKGKERKISASTSNGTIAVEFVK